MLIKEIFVFTFLLILVINYNNYIANINIEHSFAQKLTEKKNSWLSKRDNLNITMSLSPPIPTIDQNTKISFDIKKLNNTGASNFENMSGRVIIADNDGRLFKFANQNITNSKLSVNYIFPSNGSDRIILELYKNKTPFNIGSFNVNITSQSQQQNSDFFSNLFKGL
jgi:hypothetical protein